MSIETITRTLVEARRRHHMQPGAPLANVLADDGEAYAVQDRVAQALGLGARSEARYWKSGGPSPSAKQTHAPLPPAGVHRSPARLTASDFHRLGIEAELAFRVGRDAPPREIVDAIDAMCVSIELVDTRWAEGIEAPARLKLADLQAHGALVLGEWLPLREVDWSQQACRVGIGAETREFRGTHSFGDPRKVLPRWAEHVAGTDGVVRDGTVVTTGTWCGILWAQPGTDVVVEFAGIGRAQLSL
jgi:2-keto-4-pentenoate hydratase